MTWTFGTPAVTQTMQTMTSSLPNICQISYSVMKFSNGLPSSSPFFSFDNQTMKLKVEFIPNNAFSSFYPNAGEWEFRLIASMWGHPTPVYSTFYVFTIKNCSQAVLSKASLDETFTFRINSDPSNNANMFSIGAATSSDPYCYLRYKFYSFGGDLNPTN